MSIKKKCLALLSVLTVAMSLCANVYASNDAAAGMRTPTPVLVTYKDELDNTWGFVLSCTGAGKTAVVDTYFQLEKVHDSSPETWADIANTVKTVTNSSTVYTFEGGVDSTHCGGSDTFETEKGDLMSQYTYLSTVSSITATHKFSYTYDGVSSSFSHVTSFSYGEHISASDETDGK